MSNPEEEYPSPRRGHPARAVVNGAPASPYTLVPIHLLSQISSLHTFSYTFVPTHLPYPAPLSLHIRCLTLFSLYISPALPFCPNACAPPYRGGSRLTCRRVAECRTLFRAYRARLKEYNLTLFPHFSSTDQLVPSPFQPPHLHTGLPHPIRNPCLQDRLTNRSPS